MPSRISDARAEPEREDPVKNFASASDPHKLGGPSGSTALYMF